VDTNQGGYFGYHEPMSVRPYGGEAKNRLRKTRGWEPTPIYIYDTLTKSLIFMSDSKQYLSDNIGIHNSTINNCLIEGKLFLNRFFLPLDIISEFPFENILILDKFIDLIKQTKLDYKPVQPKSKRILAENIKNKDLTRTFISLNELVKHLNGDRATIRKYLTEESKGLYRNQWKFSYLDSEN
jgi:NUMOD1 domain-containing protein